MWLPRDSEQQILHLSPVLDGPVVRQPAPSTSGDMEQDAEPKLAPEVNLNFPDFELV